MEPQQQLLVSRAHCWGVLRWSGSPEGHRQHAAERQEPQLDEHGDSGDEAGGRVLRFPSAWVNLHQTVMTHVVWGAARPCVLLENVIDAVRVCVKQGFEIVSL